MLNFALKKIILFLIMVCIVLISSFVHADPIHVSLNFKNASLVDVIHIIAKLMDINVIISPKVQGLITIYLQNVTKPAALNMLLKSQGLKAWRNGNILYIAKAEELIKHRQDELKWKEINEAMTPLDTYVLQIKYAKAEDVAQIIGGEHSSFLSKRGKVSIDTRTNIICIHDSKERIIKLNQFIKRLDVPLKQIEVAARLVSIDCDFERELGLRFVSLAEHSIKQGDSFLQKSSQIAGNYSLSVAKLADDTLLDVKLAALENKGHAELISSPKLFTTNQQSASIEAGEDVPYQEVSEGGGTAVAFKKAVLGLRVIPQVLPGNKVLLQLQINQDRPSNKSVQGVPTISTRQIVTNILLRNGQTIVLGGIYETNNEESKERIPYISQIPLLGLLFTRHHNRENKRELLIFVTPRIIL